MAFANLVIIASSIDAKTYKVIDFKDSVINFDFVFKMGTNTASFTKDTSIIDNLDILKIAIRCNEA
jgi:hypothetical protein